VSSRAGAGLQPLKTEPTAPATGTGVASRSELLTTARVHPPEHPAIDRWYAGARLANAALGLWLFTSAFAWRHFEASLHNTWLVGALIFASALAALRRSAWRWANTALGGWLFASTLFLFRPLDLETLWNNVLVAVLVFALSLVTRGAGSADTTEIARSSTADAERVARGAQQVERLPDGGERARRQQPE
jgi:hypothetical protein